jgi:hypothetical protein
MHGAIFQKAAFFIVTADETSNPAQFVFVCKINVVQARPCDANGDTT